MKFILILLLNFSFIHFSMACKIDPKYPKHELTTEALNKIFKDHYFSAHEITSLKTSDFSFDYSDPNMSKAGCPDIFKLTVIARYVDENKATAEFEALVTKTKKDFRTQITRTCCKR
jgi:hypothetical protein